MTKSLKILNDNRDNLLKVELAGWLHDMFKCSDEQIDIQSVSPMLSKGADKTFYFDSIKDFDICFKGSFKESASLTMLIEKGMPRNLTNVNFPILVRYLGRCHGAAHIEKEESKNLAMLKKLNKKLEDYTKQKKDKQDHLAKIQNDANRALKKNGFIPQQLESPINEDKKNIRIISNELQDIGKKIDMISQGQYKYPVKQNRDNTFMSSVFGYESFNIKDLTSRFKKSLNQNRSLEYKDIKAIRELFSEALGDTRRPANEVTLEDWSFLVATLFKSAVAGAILEAENGVQPVTADKLRWRFLSVRISGEQVFGNSASISDLLARKNWINEGLDIVKRLLEEEYSLGNEVYRDENGSVFVVPDIEDILNYVFDDTTETLEKRIKVKLDFRGELTPEIAISESWWGQKPLGTDQKDETPPIGAIISKQPFSPAAPKEISTYWNQIQSKQMCRISWLRPEEDKTRHISKFWADKIKGRAETWLKEKNTTIWIDEIADSNSKIALVSAKLDISNWVGEEDGKPSLIKTLNYETPPVSKRFEDCAKEPSFARVRRVWETTNKFWDEALVDIKKIVGTQNERLVFKVQSNNLGNLSENNAYEAEVNGIKFTVFVDKKSHENGLETAECIVIENLQLLDKKLVTEKNQNKSLPFIDRVKKEIDSKPVKFYNSNNASSVAKAEKINVIEPERCSYSPVIEITNDPERFMVLVPADKALEAAKKIKEKYEREMGKVRNRLPMNLGIVYAGYHTALPAIMDAGRRLMQIKNNEEPWTLTKQPELQTNSDKFELSFESGQTWVIPSKMGDCSEDLWYPYFYVDNQDKFELEKRLLSFKGPSGNWLIHVSQLKEGDKVLLTPSYFDFEYLSSASERFEISYNSEGKRRSKDRKQRPYYLDDLNEIEKVWATLSSRLSNSQIKKLNTLVEEKRRDWADLLEKNDGTFKSYIENVVNNLRWKQPLAEDEKDRIIDFCVDGKLADVLEIHMSILKDKSEVAE